MADRTIIIAGTGAGGPAVYNLAAAETFRIRSVSWRQTVVAPVGYGEPAIPELLAYDAAGNLIARVLAPAVIEEAPPPPPQPSHSTLLWTSSQDTVNPPDAFCRAIWDSIDYIDGDHFLSLTADPVTAQVTEAGQYDWIVDVTYSGTPFPNAANSIDAWPAWDVAPTQTLLLNVPGHITWQFTGGVLSSSIPRSFGLRMFGISADPVSFSGISWAWTLNP